jgi:hypothetical protein
MPKEAVAKIEAANEATHEAGAKAKNAASARENAATVPA